MRTGLEGEPELCALPGCDKVIEQAVGRPQRLYCSAAHRATARRLRSRSLAGTLHLRAGAADGAAPYVRNPEVRDLPVRNADARKHDVKDLPVTNADVSVPDVSVPDVSVPDGGGPDVSQPAAGPRTDAGSAPAEPEPAAVAGSAPTEPAQPSAARTVLDSHVLVNPAPGGHVLDEPPTTQPFGWHDAELNAGLPWAPVKSKPTRPPAKAAPSRSSPRQRKRLPRQQTPRQRRPAPGESIPAESGSTELLPTELLPIEWIPSEPSQAEPFHDEPLQTEPFLDEPAHDTESTQDTEPAQDEPAQNLIVDEPWLAVERLTDTTRPPRQRVIFHLPRNSRPRPAGQPVDDDRGSGGRIGAIGHRQRATVVLATALVLLGGSAWAGTTSVRMQQGGGDHAAVAPDAAQWAQQAEGTLTLVSQQLDLIAQAENAWNSQPPARRKGPAPAALTQLRSTKSELEDQRRALQDKIDAWRALPNVQVQLTDIEKQVAGVNELLSTAPTATVRSSEHQATISNLTEQKDMWLSQLGAKRAELDRLKSDVESAVKTPLPAVSDLVAPSVESVLKLTDPDTQNGPGGSDRESPSVTAPRAEGNARPKDDVGVGAPPNPLGLPGTEPDAARTGKAGKSLGSAVDSAAKGLADKTKDAANGLADKTEAAAKGLADTTTKSTRDVADSTKDAAKDVADSTRDAAHDVADSTGDATKGLADTTAKTTRDVAHRTTDVAESDLPTGKSSVPVAESSVPAGKSSVPRGKSANRGSDMHSAALAAADAGIAEAMQIADRAGSGRSRLAGTARSAPPDSVESVVTPASAMRSRVSDAAMSAARSEVRSRLADELDAASADTSSSADPGPSSDAASPAKAATDSVTTSTRERASSAARSFAESAADAALDTAEQSAADAADAEQADEPTGTSDTSGGSTEDSSGAEQ